MPGSPHYIIGATALFLKARAQWLGAGGKSFLKHQVGHFVGIFFHLMDSFSFHNS